MSNQLKHIFMYYIHSPEAQIAVDSFCDSFFFKTIEAFDFLIKYKLLDIFCRNFLKSK